MNLMTIFFTLMWWMLALCFGLLLAVGPIKLKSEWGIFVYAPTVFFLAVVIFMVPVIDNSRKNLWERLRGGAA